MCSRPGVSSSTRARSRSRGRSSGGTSLAGGKVRTGRMHGMKKDKEDDHDEAPRRHRSKSASNSSRGRRPRSKSRERKKKPVEYATPFDEKGRCHYHKNVQLAAKKQFGGGWKCLLGACPKCMEDSGDEKSVKSHRSARSAATAGSSNAHGKYDKNGCCAVHGHIQVAKKNFLGSGWKVIRTCPACKGEDVDADDYSVKSGRSAKSAKSTKSSKSAKSKSSSASRGAAPAPRTHKSGQAAASSRYGAMPFDGDGYCCRHPSVQIAQKKMIGGFKIIHAVCPDCAEEDGVGDRKKKSRGSSRSRSKSRDRRSAKSGHESGSSVGSDKKKKTKKRIRVKNLKTEDENGRHGRYSGYVDDDHRPNGQGTIVYENGDEWEGVWETGSQAHGKLTKAKKLLTN